MCSTGSRFDRAVTVATTNPPSRRSCDRGAAGRDTAGGGDGRALVTARGQPGSLAGRVDAADLHRHRCDAGQTQHQDRDQHGDAERRFHGGRAGIVG